VTAKHDFDCEGLLLQKLENRKLLLVNGPGGSLKLLNTDDLSCSYNLEMKPFVLSDDTKIGNATWTQRREQGAMHPEYERKEWYKNLNDEDQKLIKMLRAAQDD